MLADLVRQIDAELDKLEREAAKLERARAVLLDEQGGQPSREAAIAADDSDGNRQKVVDFLSRVGQAPRVEVLQATGIPRGSLNAALDSLQAEGLLRREGNQGSGGVTLVWTGERTEAEPEPATA